MFLLLSSQWTPVALSSLWRPSCPPPWWDPQTARHSWSLSKGEYYNETKGLRMRQPSKYSNIEWLTSKVGMGGVQNKRKKCLRGSKWVDFPHLMEFSTLSFFHFEPLHMLFLSFSCISNFYNKRQFQKTRSIRNMYCNSVFTRLDVSTCSMWESALRMILKACL